MRVLIVDDFAALRGSLKRLLRKLPDLDFTEADSVESALAALEQPQDLVLLDIHLSPNPNERGGLDVLREMRRRGREVPTVVVAASTVMQDVREAMRLGARDYVAKEELCDDLLAPIVETFRERKRLSSEVHRLRAHMDEDWGLGAIVGSSPAIEQVRQAVLRVATSDATVLIAGETGTGKQMVAHAIHQLGPRRDAPFVVVDCSAIPAALIDRVLFGNGRMSSAVDGISRLMAAENGTLLLDQVGDLPLDVQGKLLRLLEERKYLLAGSDRELALAARILATTNVDLAKLAAEGRFRNDLLFRLDVVTLRVPSLSARGSDITELVPAFTKSLPRKLTFTARALEWLVRRKWPGNVREVKNAMVRLSIMSEADEIDVPTLMKLLPVSGSQAASSPAESLAGAVLAADAETSSRYRDVERALLRRAVELESGNRAAAARLLGLPRKTLIRRWARLMERPTGEEDDD